MNLLYPSVAARARHRCEYCLAPEAAFNFPFEVDHVIPASREGGDLDNNLALACRSCNAYKSDATVGEDPMGGGLATLFNPRRGEWTEHFTLVDDNTVRGITSVGRTTVMALRLNAPRQVTARAVWRAAGLYP